MTRGDTYAFFLLIFSPGLGWLQAALFVDFVQDANKFFIAQFLPDLLSSIEGIRIAHHGPLIR
jgi:hypothetical protein